MISKYQSAEDKLVVQLDKIISLDRVILANPIVQRTGLAYASHLKLFGFYTHDP